jgi:hypothetical protein
VAGDVACLIIVLAAVAGIGVVLFLAWIQGRETSCGGSNQSDLDVDPYTAVPYGAMDDQMDDWSSPAESGS